MAIVEQCSATFACDTTFRQLLNLKAHVPSRPSVVCIGITGVYVNALNYALLTYVPWHTVAYLTGGGVDNLLWHLDSNEFFIGYRNATCNA